LGVPSTANTTRSKIAPLFDNLLKSW